MNKIIALVVLFAASLGLSACSKPPYESVDNAQLKALVEQGVPVIDIRRPDEWKQTGVIEGSRLLTWVDRDGRVQPGFYEALAAEVQKDKPVALICRTGNRTDKLARELMQEHGYAKVYTVSNGITGWIANGNPVAR